MVEGKRTTKKTAQGCDCFLRVLCFAAALTFMNNNGYSADHAQNNSIQAFKTDARVFSMIDCITVHCVVLLRVFQEKRRLCESTFGEGNDLQPTLPPCTVHTFYPVVKYT